MELIATKFFVKLFTNGRCIKTVLTNNRNEWKKEQENKVNNLIVIAHDQ